MNAQLTPEQIRALPVEERLRLIEDLWDSLTESAENLPVPDWHLEILAERLAEADANPSDAQSWEEAKADILASLRK